MTTTGAVSGTPSPRPLWLTETYPPSRGGMAESCDRIVRSLRAAGITVDVAHLVRRLGASARFEEQEGGRYWAWPIEDDPAHALNLAWNAVSRVGRERRSSLLGGEVAPLTHVVAFGGYLPLLAGPIFAAWLGVPLVTLIRGNDFDANLFTPRRRDVLGEALARAALVCAVSQDKVERIAALHPGRRVVRVPNGIDLERFAPLPSDRVRAEAWRAANVASGRRVLGLFGQLKRKKGGAFFLDALRRSGRAGDVHGLLHALRLAELAGRDRHDQGAHRAEHDRPEARRAETQRRQGPPAHRGDRDDERDQARYEEKGQHRQHFTVAQQPDPRHQQQRQDGQEDDDRPPADRRR